MIPGRDDHRPARSPVPPHLKILNTIEEAAELYSLSERTMADLIKAGVIRSVRCGRRVLIPRVELESAWERLEDRA